MQNKKPVIAVMLTRKEKQDFVEPADMVTRHSNPNLWKGYISYREDYIYAPSYPKIEEAYEKAGKKIFRPEQGAPKGEEAVKPSGEENITPAVPDTPPHTPPNNTEEGNNITNNEYNEDTNVQKDDIVSEDDFIVEDVADKKPESEVGTSSIISQYSDAASIPWPKLRSVAAKISSVPVKSKEQAIEIVQAEYYD